jgi:predicted site-specific integrase-resolvase
MITVKRASEILGVGTCIVRVWCRSGNLQAEKLGRDWMVNERSAKRLALARKLDPPKRGPKPK